MADPLDYCAELVRGADRDRFLAALFAPPDNRAALFALYAFNVEISRVRDAAREPLAGEVRLQWWSEVLDGERPGEAQAHPVAAALMRAVDRYHLPAAALADLVEARRFDLYSEPMATAAALEDYTTRTFSTPIEIAAQILGVDARSAAVPAGIASGIAAILRSLPDDAVRGRVFLPADVLQRHGLTAEAILARRPSSALDAAVAELRDMARRHLAAARPQIMNLPQQAHPAFLPMALVRPRLHRLERRDPFTPIDLAPWRRQWLIWRAARNPARIAG